MVDWVLPEHQGSGVGVALLTYVENAVHESGARLLVIETSDKEPMGRARRFYTKAGYTERGRTPDFYGDGEGKVIFSKRL